MRFLTIFIGLLAVSSILAQKAPVSAAPAAKVENMKLKSDIARMEKLRAELNDITEKGGDYELHITLKKKAPTPKAILKPTKVEKKIAKIEKKVEKAIEKAKIQIEIAEKTKDTKKQEKAQQKLSKLYRKEEYYRVKEEKIIQKKVHKLEKQEKKAQKKIDACVQGVVSEGCKTVMKKHFQREQVISKLKEDRQKIVVKISDSRENHLTAFKNVKAVEVKKAIILNRYNVKTTYLENKITKEEKKIILLEQRTQTPKILKKIETERKKLIELKVRVVQLEKQKIKVVRLQTTGCTCGCAVRLRKILNVIHINLVTKGPNGENKIEKKIIRFTSSPGQKSVKLIKVNGGVVRLRINTRKVDSKTFRIHARAGKRSTKVVVMSNTGSKYRHYRVTGRNDRRNRRYRKSVARRERRRAANRRRVARRNRRRQAVKARRVEAARRRENRAN